MILACQIMRLPLQSPDENSAALLNSKVSDGKVTFQVQGRNFTLTRICRVLFQ